MSPLLTSLAQRGEERRYRKDTLLIQEGDVGDTLYIILKGRLRAYTTGDKDRELTYGTYGPGEYIGEMSLDGGPRSASVVTLEASTCVVVTRTTLRAFIAEHPDFAFELLSKVIRRARAASLNAKQMALNDAYGRLAALLNDLARLLADGTPFVAGPLTHLDMAQRVGCSREMVSRLMKDLQRGGYIDADRRGIRLLKPLPQRW